MDIICKLWIKEPGVWVLLGTKHSVVPGMEGAYLPAGGRAGQGG
jgi:hypothetical protein